MFPIPWSFPFLIVLLMNDENLQRILEELHMVIEDSNSIIRSTNEIPTYNSIVLKKFHSVHVCFKLNVPNILYP